MRIRNRKKKFQAVLKLDMKKAYDRLEWNFLEACMLKMGFSEIWVNGIMTCVRTVSFNVKFNGEPLPFFQPSRGLRQGDPLSPYLFILMANTMSCLIKSAVEEGTSTGIRLNKHCYLSTFGSRELAFSAEINILQYLLPKILFPYLLLSGN